MKRITFLIGNGFDVNVGLDTTYGKFYEYYITQHPEDMLAKDIGKHYENWSDLEQGLGEFTAKISKNQKEEFFRSQALLEEKLMEYLKCQMERVDILGHEDIIAENMKTSITHFFDSFAKLQKKDIVDLINSTQQNIEYSFVSFNYTDILDRCVNLMHKMYSRSIAQHFVGDSTYGHYLGGVLHIHGTVESEHVLGVNDIEQIANKAFQETSLDRQLLIKSETNARYGQNKVLEMQSVIDESIIVCIFGMSLGSTDKMWWEYVLKWLQDDDCRRLVVFTYNANLVERVSKLDLFLSEDHVYECLQSYSGIGDKEWNELKRKIYIQHNSNLFDFKVVCE